ncbi:MAG TPA: hypothetical protein VK805_15190 [Candidatus Baltobacteraceae bacterium]|jgi:hypothetical protein|nr:hypothetical protein [Candidatus Baltobacteraceae bacterium]
MNLEYRTCRGQRIEINANGTVLPGTGPVNLRTMGCPEYIARKVETSNVLRRAAAAMAIGTPAPASTVVTDADRRAKAAQIETQIAEDARKLQADAELKNRLQAAAGISHGRR